MTDTDTADTTTETKPAASRVTIEGPGISITRPVDEATLSKVVALLFGAPISTAQPSGGGTPAGGGAETKHAGGSGGGAKTVLPFDEDLTLGEFIVETDADTFQKKIAAAGYYLMNYDGQAGFTREEVKNALIGAHEDMPANYPRDFTASAASNLITADPSNEGNYFLPRSGRTAVESRFTEMPKRRIRKAAKRGASSRDDA